MPTPAVAHDRQLCIAIAAAAKAVADIGKAILVQPAGQGSAGAERERRGGRFRDADREQAAIDQRDD